MSWRAEIKLLYCRKTLKRSLLAAAETKRAQRQPSSIVHRALGIFTSHPSDTGRGPAPSARGSVFFGTVKFLHHSQSEGSEESERPNSSEGNRRCQSLLTKRAKSSAVFDVPVSADHRSVLQSPACMLAIFTKALCCLELFGCC